MSDFLRLGAFLLDPSHPQAIAEMRRLGDFFDPNRAWVTKDGRPYRLSDRVWDARQSSRDQIDAMVRASIRAGADPLTTARKLEEYLNPAYRPVRTATGRLRRRQAKGVTTLAPGRAGRGSYAARRLMRTETAAAMELANRDAARMNPFAETLGYRLSPNHPRADICDPLAERDVGWGPGNYPINECPLPPRHPHCLCFTVVNQVENSAAVVDVLRQRYGLPRREDAFVQPSRRAQAATDRALFHAARIVKRRIDLAAA